MIKVPEIFKGNENFWEFNSEYVFILDKFYKSDKTKNKAKSSKIMWAFYHKLHPDSAYYNLKNKEQTIKEKWLKDKNFDWKKYEDVELTFKDSILTEAEKSLYDWNELMKKRNLYLKNQEYYFDEYKTDENGDNILSKTGQPVLRKGTAKQLDDAHTTTIKYYADYSKIMKELKQDKLKRGKAGKPLSASDANRI